MDRQLLELESRLRTGDLSAVVPLERWHRRHGSRLAGLTKEQIAFLLRECVSVGVVPKIALPISNWILPRMLITIAGFNGFEFNYMVRFPVEERSSSLCRHNHRKHRSAVECAKRKARAMIWKAIERKDSEYLEYIGLI